MIVFAIETGLRLEEQLSLEWSQVNQRRHELTLTKTKTSNPRVVPLTDKAAQILAQQPRHLTSPTCSANLTGLDTSGYSGLRLEKRVRLINCRDALGSERNDVHPAAAEAVRGLAAL